MADEGVRKSLINPELDHNEMVTWCLDTASHERHSWTESGIKYTCVGTNNSF